METTTGFAVGDRRAVPSEQPEPVDPANWTGNILRNATVKCLSPAERDFIRDHLAEFTSWALEYGKNQNTCTGLSEDTVDGHLSSLNQAVRLHATRRPEAVDWQYKNSVPDDIETGLIDIPLGPELTEGTIQSLGKVGKKAGTQRKAGNAFVVYFNWLNWTQEAEIRWRFDKDISKQEKQNRPDPINRMFKPDHRKKLKQAALKLGVPDPEDIETESEREQYRNRVSQLASKPLDEVEIEDFRVEAQWLLPSVVGVGSDAGLRPSTMGDVKPSWFADDFRTLEVPSSHTPKYANGKRWPLSTDTQKWCKWWMEERSDLARFRNADEEVENRMWLTRESTPLNSKILTGMSML